jgi:hypothetical protein
MVIVHQANILSALTFAIVYFKLRLLTLKKRVPQNNETIFHDSTLSENDSNCLLRHAIDNGNSEKIRGCEY